MAHDARLNARRADGTTEREHVQFFADKGKAWAIARLAPRAVPEFIAYLQEWFAELLEGATEGMSGRMVTHADVTHWKANYHRRPSPAEVRALFRMDGIRRNPDALTERTR